MRRREHQSGFGTTVILLVVLVVAVLAVTGLVVYQHHRTSKDNAATGSPQSTGQSQSTTSTQSAPSVTYTSSQEKASFQYPSNWIASTPSQSSSTDSISLKSPSGAITISWISTITPGFGNEHNASYPAHTVIDKTPITNAPGLYVVSGITTLDGNTYYPWIAVQDSNGILTSGVKGDLLLFTGRHNVDTSTNSHAYVLFSTSGPRAHEISPALTQSQATAWFSGTEAQQAKQILLSFSDPQ